MHDDTITTYIVAAVTAAADDVVPVPRRRTLQVGNLHKKSHNVKNQYKLHNLFAWMSANSCKTSCDNVAMQKSFIFGNIVVLWHFVCQIFNWGHFSQEFSSFHDDNFETIGNNDKRYDDVNEKSVLRGVEY